MSIVKLQSGRPPAKRDRPDCPDEASNMRALTYATVLCAALAYGPAWAEPVANAPPAFESYPQPKPYKARPPIPVRMMPLSVVDPPRNVSAQQWRSPYCTAWTDGKALCKRDAATRDAATVCIADTADYGEAYKAGPTGVSCLFADLDALSRVCSKWALYDPGIPIPHFKAYQVRTRGYGLFVQENWVWRDKKWAAIAGENDAALVRRNHWRQDLPELRTYLCMEAYSAKTKWRAMTAGRLD
jgi:hypothetical protein